MPDIEALTAAPDRLQVKVVLEVTTTAYVTIATDSSKTVDQMRDAALAKFDEHGGTEYRNQFRSTTAIELASKPNVKVRDLSIIHSKLAVEW